MAHSVVAYNPLTHTGIVLVGGIGKIGEGATYMYESPPDRPAAEHIGMRAGVR